MLAVTKKLQKMRFWSLPNPSKSSPERSKTHKNQPRATTNAARSGKSAQEAPKKRPRAPKCAKKRQHSPNMVPNKVRILRSEGVCPPHKVLRSIRSCILKHLGLTRLGTASSAADFDGSAIPPTPSATTATTNDDGDGAENFFEI